MAIMPIHYAKCIMQDGYNDLTRTVIGGFLAAAATTAAVYNAVEAVRIATREWELAKDYWEIAENWLDYYKTTYAPLEDKELVEATALEDEQPNYAVQMGRGRAYAWYQFKGRTRTLTRRFSKYHTGRLHKTIEDLYTAQTAALSTCAMLGYRNERAYIETRSDERFKKQLNTVKRGRDMAADSPSFARASAGVFGNMFEQAWNGAVSAGTTLGYILNRNETSYPQVGIARMNPSIREQGERLMEQP